MSPKNQNGRNVCQRCDFTCASSTAFNAHMVNNHGAEPHQCPSCPSKFADKANLRRHINNKHNNKKVTFYCTKCDRNVGKRKDNARRHERQNGCFGHVFCRTEGRPDELLASSDNATVSIAQPLQTQQAPAVEASYNALATNGDLNPGLDFTGDQNLELTSDYILPDCEIQLFDSSLGYQHDITLEPTGQILPGTYGPQSSVSAQRILEMQFQSKESSLQQDLGYTVALNNTATSFASHPTMSFGGNHTEADQLADLLGTGYQFMGYVPASGWGRF